MSYYLNKLRKALDKLIWGWMLCFLVIISHVWHVRCCSCNSCWNLILFACLLKLAHDLMLMDAQSWSCVCLACSFWCIVYCTFVHSYICIIAPHLGTIDEPREGRDIGTKHEDDVWWTYPEEAKNPEYMLGPEYSPSECHLTNTDLVLIPGKPRSITYYFNLWNVIYIYLIMH